MKIFIFVYPVPLGPNLPLGRVLKESLVVHVYSGVKTLTPQNQLVILPTECQYLL